MTALKWCIIVLLLLLTAVFGFIFSIAVPIFMMDYELEGISDNPVLIVWIISSVLGYFIPTILFNLKLYKLSSIFASIGTCLILYTHSIVGKMLPDAGFMYLPQIFVTILTIIYAVIIEWRKYAFQKKEIKKAPSILGDN